jgi:hypothetical protein
MCGTFRQTLCALVSFALISLLGIVPARADILDGLGAIGAGSASNAPTNYPGILQDYAGLNFGGPGIPYAFGYIGSDSLSILQPGNQVDLAVAQILAGNITLMTMGIGNNDYIDEGDNIASGALSGAALAAFQQQVADNIATGVNALQGAGAAVTLGGFTNIVHSPNAATIKADPVARANLETALADGNVLVRDVALSHGIPFIDFFDLLSAVYDAGSAQLGGVDLLLTGYDTDPHYFWEDQFHAGIIVRGAIANLFIEAINDGYGTSIPLLSDLEILTLAGLEDEYVEETFEVSYAYRNFVTVPEPSALVLAAIGLAVLVTFGVPRVTRRHSSARHAPAYSRFDGCPSRVTSGMTLGW